MKKILDALALGVMLFAFLSINIFAQKPSRKLTAEEVKERIEVVAFVDSFMQEYYKTYDLTKVPETFFVSDYKKRNSYPFFINTFDSLLTDEEKFQNGFMAIDLLHLGFFNKLSEANYDLKKALGVKNEDEPSDNALFGKKLVALFQKYPKSTFFLT